MTRPHPVPLSISCCQASAKRVDKGSLPPIVGPRGHSERTLIHAPLIRRENASSSVQHPLAEEGGVRPPPWEARVDVRLRHHAAGPDSSRSREDLRRVRRHRPVPPLQGLPRLLSAKRDGHRGPHHREDEVDREAVGRDRRAVFRGIPGRDGAAALHVRRPVRLRNGLYGRDRGADSGTHQEGTRLHRGGPERLFRHDDLLRMGQAQRSESRGAPPGCPHRNRGAQATSGGLRPLEGPEAGGARLGQSLGTGPARVAHRGHGDHDPTLRGAVRLTWRRDRTRLPPSRGGDRAGGILHGRHTVRPVLDARRHGHGERRRDAQVARELLAGPSGPRALRARGPPVLPD